MSNVAKARGWCRTSPRFTSPLDARTLAAAAAAADERRSGACARLREPVAGARVAVPRSLAASDRMPLWCVRLPWLGTVQGSAMRAISKGVWARPSIILSEIGRDTAGDGNGDVRDAEVEEGLHESLTVM